MKRMPDDASRTTASPARHALKVALVYLLIRGFSSLYLYIMAALPIEAVRQLLQDDRWSWLYALYPVVPVQVFNLPLNFQDSLAILPVLLMETLLVFLFSSWRLSRRPWLAGAADARPRWLPLILATLLWSCLVRSQLLSYVNGGLIDELLALQKSGANFDTLGRFTLSARWTITAIIYASIPLWALVPAWVHFRFAGRRMAATPRTEPAMTASLQRSSAFAAFLLGFTILHSILTLAVYTGLWPLAAEAAGLHLPWETLRRMDLPLTLGQIVFAILAGALAAYIYARRPHASILSGFQTFIKPALAGMAAYLLTSLAMLALSWAAAYLRPGVFTSLLRDLDRHPESSLPLALALNLLAVILLCAAGSRLRASPRRWGGVLAALVVFFAVPAWMGWVLFGSAQGIAGDQPGGAITGTLGDARWRNMEQWCTGVVETRHGTWLVGRRDEDRTGASYVPEGTPDLGAQLDPDGQSGRRGGMFFGSRPTLSTLARLQDDGTFKLMATVPDVACLVASPESDTLFLFTGLDRPGRDAASSREIRQDVIFRSTDQGATWEMLEDGFMPEVSQLGWSVRPVFASDREVWAWGDEPRSEDDGPGLWGQPQLPPTRQAPDGTELRQTALFHSRDQGKTSARIYSPEPLVAPVSYLRELAGADGARADFSGRRGDMDRERIVVQVDERRAYAWVSEVLWYRVDGRSHRLGLTTRAVLTRPDADGEWQVDSVTRVPGMHLTNAITSVDGRTYATLVEQDREWLAKLDTTTGEWVERRETPALLPRWLARPAMETRYFQNNGDYQVVSLWGDVIVPRILFPFGEEAAEISADAHFYTRDGGRTWHQLAIPGYLGVMGLSPRGSKLYWSKGNWYSNDAPEQWQYDLAQ